MLTESCHHAMTCHHFADGGQQGGKQAVTGGQLGVQKTLRHETNIL
jgi:hypothetical protein